MQESLRCYTVVPVVVRELARDDVLCGHRIPRGSHVVQSLKAVHQQWADPEVWRPERFMPGDEYDQFSEDIRQYMVSANCSCAVRAGGVIMHGVVISCMVSSYMLHAP